MRSKTSGPVVLACAYTLGTMLCLAGVLIVRISEMRTIFIAQLVVNAMAAGFYWFTFAKQKQVRRSGQAE